MCSKRQALKPRSIVVVTNPPLWSSSHWELLLEVVSMSAGVFIADCALLWLITQNLIPLPLWCRCHLVGIGLWCDGNSTRAKARLPCWDQNHASICVFGVRWTKILCHVFLKRVYTVRLVTKNLSNPIWSLDFPDENRLRRNEPCSKKVRVFLVGTLWLLLRPEPYASLRNYSQITSFPQENLCLFPFSIVIPSLKTCIDYNAVA